MPTLQEHVETLQPRFGVLAESNTYQLTVIAGNTDVAVGDLFLLPCDRGAERFYIFRTTQYANIMNRTIELNDVARNKLTMEDSYFSEDWGEEKLVELKGIVLGYAQRDSVDDAWSFHRPRRLPQHLTDVFHVAPNRPEIANVVRELMQSQLGTSGIYIGDLLAGEQPLTSVPVYLPSFAFSHHIGVFGRTGCGKSNLMMVLLRSIMLHNQSISEQGVEDRPISILAIDPHDEFRRWHYPSGGVDGIHGIVNGYKSQQQQQLIEPFYYLTAKDAGDTGLERRVVLSRADVTPSDLFSVMEFSEQQMAFANQFYAQNGEHWVTRLLIGDTGDDDPHAEAGGNFLPGTVSAVQRRLGGLTQGNTRIFTRFDPDLGHEYRSMLPDIVCAIEQGRVLVIDTTLMTELEQFLLTTIVARTLFALRKALKSCETTEQLETEIRGALGNDDSTGTVGMRTLADNLMQRLNASELPYRNGNSVASVDALPIVNVVVEEAPSILNPARMRFGSVFRDISRQGRKFGIGLSVISQQVSEIDHGVLTQLNTELTMSLGNETERKEAIRNASSDLSGFEREMQILSRGQSLLSASYKDVPLPLLTPPFSVKRLDKNNA